MIIAASIFLFTYLAFSIGRVPGLRSDRTAAAIVGAAFMVACGVLTMSRAQAAVDGGTLALLFGMMVLSAALEVSGAFALIGWHVTSRTRSAAGLLVGVCVVSGILSAFLINDVVCIAFTPIVLRVCAALDIDARPHLIGLATSSNIGSAATITGNPQNILIGSLSHISYVAFAGGLAPVAAVSLAVNILLICVVFRSLLTAPLSAQPVARPRRILRPLAWKAAVVTGAVLAAFLLGVQPAVAAMVGGAMILLTRGVSPARFYAHVDWQLLALFAGLFVVVGGVEQVGLANRLFACLQPLRPQSVGGLTTISAILSNVVSNVPAVMVLKSLIPRLPHPERAWLTLAMSSTLAGNLTLPGSLATIIVVERARGKAKISPLDFMKVGVPTSIIGLLLGAGWLAVSR